MPPRNYKPDEPTVTRVEAEWPHPQVEFSISQRLPEGGRFAVVRLDGKRYEGLLKETG